MAARHARPAPTPRPAGQDQRSTCRQCGRRLRQPEASPPRARGCPRRSPSAFGHGLSHAGSTRDAIARERCEPGSSWTCSQHVTCDPHAQRGPRSPAASCVSHKWLDRLAGRGARLLRKRLRGRSIDFVAHGFSRASPTRRVGGGAGRGVARVTGDSSVSGPGRSARLRRARRPEGLRHDEPFSARGFVPSAGTEGKARRGRIPAVATPADGMPRPGSVEPFVRHTTSTSGYRTPSRISIVSWSRRS